VRLWLQPRYTNVGSDPIILNRFSAIIVRHMTSRDERSATKRDYEDDVHHNILFSSALNPTTGSSPSEKQFVILKAGESYEVDARSAGFVRLAADQVRRYSKGNHVLQVSVATWTEPLPLAKELSVIWRDYGVLWWQDVTSEPTPFKIEKPTSTGKCSEYDQSQVN
jgi:hypothetical protein